MDNVLVAMIGFAFVGAVTPGPVNILAISTAVQQGKTEACKLVVGASISYALVVYLSGSLLYGFAQWLPKLEAVLQVCGSAFLAYLAYKIYSAPVERIAMNDAKRSGWWSGWFTQLLNPKAWLVAMSGVSLYVIGQLDQQHSLLVFTTVSLGACLAGVGCWAILGQVFTKFLETPSKQRTFNRVMAITLLASVSMIWF